MRQPRIDTDDEWVSSLLGLFEAPIVDGVALGVMNRFDEQRLSGAIHILLDPRPWFVILDAGDHADFLSNVPVTTDEGRARIADMLTSIADSLKDGASAHEIPKPDAGRN